MAATQEQKAPGCFGAASVYGMESEVCRGCVAFEACGEQSIKTLESIRELVDVRDLLKKHAAARLKAQHVALRPPAPPVPVTPSPIPVKQPAPLTAPIERTTTSERVTFSISDHDAAVIEQIGSRSVKAKQQAIVLGKTNKINEMRALLPKGINPFATSGPKFLSVACDMLIHGGFSKASYKAALREVLGWTDNTAGSHVAIACALLYSFGIMTNVGEDTSGSFILNPALGRDNTASNDNERKAA